MVHQKAQIKRYRRFHGYDYSRGATLFITIATEPRRPLFGRIVDARPLLTPLGDDVLAALEAIPKFNPGFILFSRVVMPDHVHFRIYFPSGLAEPLAALGAAVGKFKSWTTTCARKRLGLPRLWQEGYHDYICVSKAFAAACDRYTVYNPLKYQLRYNEPAFLHLHEPLSSPRLDAADYWKGVGELSLLDAKQKIVSLRVSRQVRDFSLLLEKMTSAAAKGYAVISGFISPGEIAVRDMLLRHPNGKLIHVLPTQLSHTHKPDSRFLAPIREHRMLEIGRGNDEVDFSRGACLDLNAEIIEIATAETGLALYWRADGPRILTQS